MAKTILLTGATGFLGSHLLEALLNAGYEVSILKRSTSDTWRIDRLLDRVKSYDVDKEPIAKAFEERRIDAVIHTACHYGRNSDPISEIVEGNLMFGLRLLEAAISFNTDTFFNTDTLLQKHLNVYTLSKKQFVEWLRQQSEKIQVVNLKLEHMYGPKDDTTKFVPWVVSQLKQNVPEIKLTKGEQKRDFIYIDDVVSAYMVALEKTHELDSFSEFNVGTGELTTLKAFVEQLKEAYEANFGVPATKLAFGAIPYRKGEMISVEVDNTALIKLGWKQRYGLLDGLGEMLEKGKLF